LTLPKGYVPQIVPRATPKVPLSEQNQLALERQHKRDQLRGKEAAPMLEAEYPRRTKKPFLIKFLEKEGIVLLMSLASLLIIGFGTYKLVLRLLGVG